MKASSKDSQGGSLEPPEAPSRRARGFTLTEVMIAVSILVSMTVIVWGSIGVSFRSRDHYTQTFDQFQALRQAMDRMTRELSGAYITAHANRRENLPDPKGLLDAVEQGVAEGDAVDEAVDQVLQEQAQKELERYSRDNYVETAFVGKEEEVHFTSMSHVRTRPGELSSEQCEISYFVRRGQRSADGRLTRELVRREDISLDDDVEEGGIIYTLIEEVEDVKFEYWKPGKEGDEEDGGRWVNDWDSRQAEFRGTLPRRVKITVTVPRPGATGGRDTRTFTTQAQINMTEILDY